MSPECCESRDNISIMNFSNFSGTINSINKSAYEIDEGYLFDTPPIIQKPSFLNLIESNINSPTRTDDLSISEIENSEIVHPLFFSENINNLSIEEQKNEFNSLENSFNTCLEKPLERKSINPFYFSV